MRLRQSVFFKITLIIIVSVIAINFSVGWLFHHFIVKSRGDTVAMNIDNYTGLLMREIGNPPDMDKVRELEQRTLMTIIPDTSLQSLSERYESFKADRRFGSTWLARTKRKLIAVHESDGRMTAFMFRDPGRSPDIDRGMIFLFATITIITVLMYFVIKQILRPVREMSRGMREISAGNLDYRVAVTSSDELGMLAHSFNEMNARIRQTLAAKERLLYDISHELRTPATRIRLAAELLEESSLKQSIIDDLNEMESMTASILRAGSLSGGTPQLQRSLFSLRSLLSEIAARYNEQAPRITLKAEDTPISGDRELLGLAIRNIVDNAIKHSGGSEITLFGSSTDTTVSIRITDNGVGIPEEEASRIFDPFYRVDSSRSRATGGFGLGLSISRNIIIAHGGSIAIQSHPGKTSFSITVPAE